MHVPLYVYGRESMDWTYHLLLLGMRQVVVCDRAPDRARSMDPPATVRCAGRGSWSIAGDSRARSSLPHRLIPIPSQRMMRRRPTQPGSQVAEKIARRVSPIPGPQPAGRGDRSIRSGRAAWPADIYLCNVRPDTPTDTGTTWGWPEERASSQQLALKKENDSAS
jgi:hypothetical protein